MAIQAGNYRRSLLTLGSLADLGPMLAGERNFQEAADAMLRAMMENSEGPRDERWKERYGDIPRAVKTARERGMGGAEHDRWGEPTDLWRQGGSQAVDVPTGTEATRVLSKESMMLTVLYWAT